MPEPKRYLTTVEAAAYLGLSDKSLEHWRLNRKGPPYIKAGGAVRYDIRKLDRWLESRTVESTQDFLR